MKALYAILALLCIGCGREWSGTCSSHDECGECEICHNGQCLFESTKCPNGADGSDIEDRDPDANDGDTEPDAHDGGLDAGDETDDGDAGTDAGDDSDAGGDEGSDAGDQDIVEPNDPCTDLVLPCLDSADADMIEVPTEMNLADAFDAATVGQTIQVRGQTISSTWWLPGYVTLHGCEGARIEGAVAFEGSGGKVEGFEVTGSVIANQTGSYVVRRNFFINHETFSEPSVGGHSRESMVYAEVELLIEQNYFGDSGLGIQLSTSYDVGTHRVDAIIRNNIFDNVFEPITISEAGLVGKITAQIEHNTFYYFELALEIWDMEMPLSFENNIFAYGNRLVDTNGGYEVDHCYVWTVLDLGSVPPVSGSCQEADPAFADHENSDFRLLSHSAVIDVIPAGTFVPPVDYFGCPRPAAFLGPELKADAGALEAQKIE